MFIWLFIDLIKVIEFFKLILIIVFMYINKEINSLYFLIMCKLFLVMFKRYLSYKVEL